VYSKYEGALLSSQYQSCARSIESKFCGPQIYPSFVQRQLHAQLNKCGLVPVTYMRGLTRTAFCQNYKLVV
jgi:hypothetical protein